MEKQKLSIEFFKSSPELTACDSFRIVGKVHPEQLDWTKNGRDIETNYLYSNAGQNEGQMVAYEGAPVCVKLKMTIPNAPKTGNINGKKRAVGVADILKAYQV